MVNPSISLAFMTHNEHDEVSVLLDYIKPFRSIFSEIVVIDDYSDDRFLRIIEGAGVKLFQRHLEGDFSAQRNFMKERCQGDYIFILDPDEIPNFDLIGNITNIVNSMHEHCVDACNIPRLNHIYEGKSYVDPRNVIFTQDQLDSQLDDYQIRLIKNSKSIRWVNKVHERIVGSKRQIRLPNNLGYSILHSKKSSRQLKQNSLYDNISGFSIKSIAKNLGLRPIAKLFGFVDDPVIIKFDIFK